MWRCGSARSSSNGCPVRMWCIRVRTTPSFPWKNGRASRTRPKPICLFRFTRIRAGTTPQEGVHDLQDLVKRIARTEKIDESKELAEDIQDSLSKRIQKSSRTVRNRGVRKAPFVVLIGADMPSILTEISFLSNPADEQLLKKPEQRQKVAEGLYQGVASYLESMNSVTMNLPAEAGVGHPAATAVEQSRNQN